ncbi:MAG: PKD domain-containing protein [Patescibacteria group bacterium]
MKLKNLTLVVITPLITVLLAIIFVSISSSVYAAQDSGSIGIEGRISAPPPTQGATISLPRDGQAFTTVPIDVSGICPVGLLVKLFKNNIFSGSQMCTNGSFSIKVDLFTGTNELVARVYDALDQPGPDSNKVTVSFNDNKQGAGSRVSLTSNFAKRGANPGQTLTWPIILSGGQGPYAISVDWGDGKAPDLKSVENPGTFSIEHIYDSPGVYNIIIKATDKNGVSAFLQLVGVANGALSQENGTKTDGDNAGGTRTRIIWQPAAISIPFIISTFWLGKRYELKMLKRKIERGDRPF